MKRASSGECLCAVFVDYDNIYLSLKRKNDEAAKRFAKDTSTWIKAIEDGSLITPTNKLSDDLDRRLVMNRCYGNPVPRRNGRDNSTDMHSFPFVRHNFLKAGFEIADCPPLTAQLKNSSDIRMVMDIRDFLEHDTYFDEFIIMSSDADFTPVLHRLRAHARRTVIFANDFTAAPYTALCDGEIREADLISFLMDRKLPQQEPIALTGTDPDQSERDLIRDRILEEVVHAVSESDRPVPIAFLADRAQRVLGHEDTVGSNWAGYGAFRSFLIENLPDDVSLSDHPPYFAFDPSRHTLPDPGIGLPSQLAPPVQTQIPAPAPAETNNIPTPDPNDLQQAIARIHDACKAPALAPADYRLLFEIMAQEISENGRNGAQSLVNIEERAKKTGLEVKRSDIEFVLEVISESDPWFEQGASPALFAGRFRNFVVARCRAAGLSLAVEELDLIDAWFAAGFAVQQAGGATATKALTQSLSKSAGGGSVPSPAIQPQPQTPALAPTPTPQLQPAQTLQSPAVAAAAAAAAAATANSGGVNAGGQVPAAQQPQSGNQRWWETNNPEKQQVPAAAGQPSGYGSGAPAQSPTAQGGQVPPSTAPTAQEDDFSQLPRIIRSQMR